MEAFIAIQIVLHSLGISGRSRVCGASFQGFDLVDFHEVAALLEPFKKLDGHHLIEAVGVHVGHVDRRENIEIDRISVRRKKLMPISPR